MIIEVLITADQTELVGDCSPQGLRMLSQLVSKYNGYCESDNAGWRFITSEVIPNIYKIVEGNRMSTVAKRSGMA